MHFDQRVHAEEKSGVFKLCSQLIIDTCHDDEDRIGAPGARFVNLVRIEKEVLSQCRKTDSLAGRGQELRRTLE